MRDEQNKYELAAEKALVMTPALIMLGRTGNERSMPSRVYKVDEASTLDTSPSHGNYIGRLSGGTRS